MIKLAIAVLVLAFATVLASAEARARPTLNGAAPTHPPSALDPLLAHRLATAKPDATLEAIVVLDEQASMPSLPGAKRGARLAAVIDALQSTATASQRPLLDLLAREKAAGRVSKVVPLWIFNGLIVAAKPQVIRELASRTEVRELRLNTTAYSPTATVSATAAPEPNLSVVNAPALWNLGDRGEGVVVASMDTGVDVTHPDLSGSWRGGSDSWYDPNGQHPTTPTDVSGHGTWTMGVMVGGDRGGTSIGVAPAARWIAAKIFNDRGVATTTGIHQSFQWLLDPDHNPATPDAPNVVNGSWSMAAAGCNLEFQLDLRALRAAGILPVFSAGNGGPGGGTSFSPANNPEALAVGATSNSDAIASFSSRGPSACDGGTFPDVTAPGVGINTTDLYGLYASESGTSMAAPHVSGVLALLLSAFPNLPVDRQESALESSAVDLGVAGPDNTFGYGRVDALAAYGSLATTPDFTLAASPNTTSTPAGGSVAYSVTVGSLNGFAGDVQLALTGLSAAQASWAFAPAAITGGAGSSQLTIATSSSLAPGTYPLTITGTSGALTHTATVTLVIPSPPDFTVAASPASASTSPGGSVGYSVTVGSLNGFVGNVQLTLTGLSPAQASWTFTPAAVAAPGSSQLTITTSGSLAPGTYPLTITGTNGSTTHAAQVTLGVTVASDFSIAVTPPSATVVRGGSANYTVTVSRTGGFTGSVSLSLTGLPFGAVGSFSPNPVGAGTSTLRISTSYWAARGTFTFTVTGKSGTLVHKTTAKLVIG
jgi:subtilisin family serine protease